MPEENTQIAPAEAQQQLTTLAADKEWGAKVLAGDQAANKQFQDLTASASGADRLTRAMRSDAPQQTIEAVGPGEMPMTILRDTVSSFRALGVRDPVIVEAVNGGKEKREIVELVKQRKAELMSDREWVRKWLDGDIEAARTMLLCNIVSTYDVTEEA